MRKLLYISPKSINLSLQLEHKFDCSLKCQKNRQAILQRDNLSREYNIKTRNFLDLLWSFCHKFFLIPGNSKHYHNLLKLLTGRKTGMKQELRLTIGDISQETKWHLKHL